MIFVWTYFLKEYILIYKVYNKSLYARIYICDKIIIYKLNVHHQLVIIKMI